MKHRLILAAGLIGAVAAFASAQDSQTTTTTQTDTTAPVASPDQPASTDAMPPATDTQPPATDVPNTTTEQQQTTTTTTIGPVSGSVVEYTPGHAIVLRDSHQKTVTYTLSPSVQVPSGIAVGRRVTIYTEPGSSNVVSRVTTVAVTSDGRLKTTTNETSMSPSGAMTKMKTVQVTGTVQTYEAGKSVTLTRPDGSTVTYMINDQSRLPSDVAIGKNVTVSTTTVSGSAQPVIQRMSYTIKTTTTKTSVQPH